MDRSQDEVDPLVGAQSPAAGSVPKDDTFCSCFSVRYYQPLFNVDTSEVSSRMLMTVLPHKATGFISSTGANPDAYGPLWAATTLIFCISVVGNLLSWVKHDAKEGFWEYDFEMVVSCMSIVYGWAFGVPTALWAVLRYLTVSIRFMTVFCACGYSLVPFIPAAVLCVIPSDVLAWLTLMSASACSVVFLLRVFGGMVVNALPKQAAVILGIMGVVQCLLGVTIKMVFFP